MKEESEHLANAIMRVTQAISQTIDDEIYKINQQVNDDKKKVRFFLLKMLSSL